MMLAHSMSVTHVMPQTNKNRCVWNTNWFTAVCAVDILPPHKELVAKMFLGESQIFQDNQ